MIGSDIEVLAVANYLLRKEEQDRSRKLEYGNAFGFD